MFPLSPAAWNDIEHAYGSAADIPDLLEQLRADPRPRASHEEEPWFTLWSSLCHQGDVYSASYVAVPHLARIARAADGPISASFFHLPACIEIARAQGRGPALTPEQEGPYRAALQDLLALAARRILEPCDPDTTWSLLALMAAAKGETSLAEAISEMDEDIIARLRDGEV